MMKKIIMVLFGLTICFLFKNDNKEILIPDNAIRFRVIANSNSINDKLEKKAIKKEIEKEIYSLIQNDRTNQEVNETIINNMGEIENIVKNYNVSYKLNYGLNYFPAKHYKGIIYPAGNYESLVITLGEGMGDNFWCVLFPPLCLIEESEEDMGEIQYKSYVKEVLDKF